MALLDSRGANSCLCPVRTAVVATGECGEHDRGTKLADTHPHHRAGADSFTSGNSTGGYPPPFGVRPDTEVVKHLVGSQRGSQNMQSARHAAERPWTRARALRRGGQVTNRNGRGIETYRSDGAFAMVSRVSAVPASASRTISSTWLVRPRFTAASYCSFPSSARARVSGSGMPASSIEGVPPSSSSKPAAAAARTAARSGCPRGEPDLPVGPVPC
jgi:hypothetical protein